MGPTQLLGWLSSGMLLVTILTQIYKQYKDQTAAGVSWFLFGGQIIASIGFTTYSVLTGDVIFIATNALLLVSHCVGLALTLYLKRKKPSTAREQHARPE